MKYTESMWEADQEKLPGGPSDTTLDSPEPIPAAWQDTYSGAWHCGDTGKIITAEKAQELLGLYKDAHAEKCDCWDCQESKSSNDDRRGEE